ncbi:MAG: flagellar biosynthetic protein FliO [Gammaproteobacteria bacterium]
MMGRTLNLVPVAAGLMPGLAAAQAGSGVNPLSEISGVVVSLVLVVGVILACAWVVRRSPLGAVTRKNGPLAIKATLPLGPKERLVLVEAVGKELLVAVSPSGIVALHESPLPRQDNADAAEETADERTFSDALGVARRAEVSG